MGKIFNRKCNHCEKEYTGEGRKFCSTECATLASKKSFNKEVVSDDNDIYKEILREIKKKPIEVHNYFPKNHVKIGLIGDTQLGSLYERQDINECLYKIFEKEGINHVYHTGDLIDGDKVYRGQEYELAYHGIDEQVKHCIDTYPYRKNIVTHFITGNHDLSFHKSVGADVGQIISAKRKDMIYLGREEVDIDMQGVMLRLAHPGKGTSYAISYQIQKMIESLTGGTKPNLLAVGHFHKAEILPLLRNIVAIQTGCTQSQTPFMRRMSLSAHLGGWILEFWVNKKEVVRIKSEFIPFYER